MRRLMTVRWLLFLLVAALAVAAGASSAEAAPQQQSTVSVVVFAYVDVASPGDPNTPCNLQFDDEDEDFAQSNPLPSMFFRLEDDGGGLIERQETSALATLQTTGSRLSVPEIVPPESCAATGAAKRAARRP